MSERVYLRRSDPTVDALIRATFPEYKGQHVIAEIRDTVRFSGTMWDEGCRRSYAIVKLDGLQTYDIPTAPFMERSNLHENEYKVPPGYVVVVHVQSRWEHIEIVSPPANITRLLPPPVVLTEDEEIVLVATRSRKASYGGVGNYRYVEARRTTGITPGRYEAAKQSLIARKLLNKAGAITVEGRNACPKKDLDSYRRPRGWAELEV
jgi:hypothetical protein